MQSLYIYACLYILCSGITYIQSSIIKTFSRGIYTLFRPGFFFFFFFFAIREKIKHSSVRIFSCFSSGSNDMSHLVLSLLKTENGLTAK